MARTSESSCRPRICRIVVIVNAKDYLTPEETKALLVKSDVLAGWDILHTWLWIAGALAISGIWPHPLTIILSIIVLGGKQVACAIIMHDASHYAMFSGKAANERWGNWLGGYPIFIDLRRYRPYHLQHHNYTGSDDDPDINLTRGYPTTRASMVRKVVRDLCGLTGIKAFAGLLAMHAGILRFNLGNRVERVPTAEQLGKRRIAELAHNIAGPLAANAILFAILWAVGAPWLYLLWFGAYLTTYQACLRVRSIAEHSVVPNRFDPQLNTRTTYANVLTRILFAPLRVNYHAEHHLLMTVPSYRFPQMHALLKARGYYGRGLLSPGYWAVLARTVRSRH